MTKEERNIAEIIKEVWDNETEDDNDQIEIYVSYIMTYGYDPEAVIGFANKYGVIYDPDISDPEDEYDEGYGSLVINSDSFAEMDI